MPKIQTLRHPAGIDVTYWRTTLVVLEPQLKLLRVNVGGWLDKAAFLADAEPLYTKTLNVGGSAYRDALQADPALKAAVKALNNAVEDLVVSQLPEFSTAVDTPDAE